jgi:aromatic ring hydroxylase
MSKPEEDVANLYRDVAGKFPSPQEAWVHNTNGSVRVTITSNQRDLIQEKSRTFVTSYTKQQG